MTPSFRPRMRARARTLALCLTAAVGSSIHGCGAKVVDMTSTDTGNPPFVDLGKLSTDTEGGTVTVTGEKGAASPGGSVVTVTNQRTGKSVSVKANADGSFSVAITAEPGDQLEVEIAGGEHSVLLRVASDDAGIDPVQDAGDASDDASNVPSATTDDTARAPSAPLPSLNQTATSVTSPTAPSAAPPNMRVPQKHRATQESCDEMRDPVRPSPDGQASPPADGGGLLTCADETSGTCCYDEDCVAGARGRCVEVHREGNSCSYDLCAQDSDCTTGGPCACGNSTGDAGALSNDTLGDICLGGNCQVDSDCDGGEFCSPSFGSCGNYYGVVAYYCHTPEDECTNDDECVDDTQPGAGFCMYSPDVSHWLCQYTQCVG
jgi:hypothetical protein